MHEVASLLAEAFEDSCAVAGKRLDTIIGNCSGAILAAEVALLLEQPPMRLVFIDPFAFLPSYFRVFLRKGFGRAAYQGTFANPVGRWITNRVLGGRKDRDTDMMSTFRVVDHEITYRYLQIFGDHEGIQKYRHYDGEVRILTGSRTFAAVRKSVKMWQELWPQAVVRELEGVGHLPIRESPVELVEFMLAKAQSASGNEDG
jgi:pimeloyl-ACP methyl ester carboxylesterase